MNKLNVLIIDDHPQIAQSFRFALQKVAKANVKYKFNITVATTIDKAYSLIVDNKDLIFDLVFLDIKLPKSKDGLLLSGEDLGLEIRKHAPRTKIVVATTYNDNHRINNIFNSIDPEGFLVKNDLTPKALINAIEEVLEDIPAYSKTIKKLLRKFTTNNISLDKIDRQILYQLSIGTKMTDLPNVISMSKGGIEYRKRQLKEAFYVANQDDRALVEKAKEKGFL